MAVLATNHSAIATVDFKTYAIFTFKVFCILYAGCSSRGYNPFELACRDGREADIQCKENEILTHKGCEGPTYMQHCVVKAESEKPKCTDATGCKK